jgi:hypothetical protein
MESGMEIITINADRHEPGNSTIIKAISPAAMAPSRSKREVLGIDRTDNVQRSEALGLQLQRIDVHDDLTISAASWGWKRHAVDRGELLTQPVDAVFVELFVR